MADEKAPSLRIFEKKNGFLNPFYCVFGLIFLIERSISRGSNGSIFLKSYINSINCSTHVSKVYLARYQCEFKSRN